MIIFNDLTSFLIYRAVMILHTIFSANLGFELVIRTTSHLIHTQNTVKRFVLFIRNRELKEARKGFFGCYSVCETMKDTKEGYFIM